MAQQQRKRYSSDPKRRAEELVAEGRIGGARPGAGRPRKRPDPSHPRPAAAAVAAAASEHSAQVAKVFVDALQSEDLTDAQKVVAMKTFLGVEDRETRREHEEIRHTARDEISAMSLEEIEADLAEMLSNPLIRRAFSAALSAVEDDSAPLSSNSCH